MKVVLLAGGLGTRLAEETGIKPKPMVEIGGMPIIWHIMKIFEAHGFNDFIICCGYKGYVIKEFFANYFLHANDITVDLKTNQIVHLNSGKEEWRITLLDTGLSTQTGGRLLRCKDYIDDDTFLMTYGDGVSDVSISDLISTHERNGGLATLTAVKPPGRFGALEMEQDRSRIKSFIEKPQGDNSYINGGYFVLNRKVFDYIDGDHSVWEKEPLSRLSEASQLTPHIHDGFWHPMDTLRDKIFLENLIEKDAAPWVTW